MGDVIEMWEAEDLKERPPVEALLAEQGDCRDHTEVLLETHLTAVGTVQLFCVDRSNADYRWGLEFNIRPTETSGS